MRVDAIVERIQGTGVWGLGTAGLGYFGTMRVALANLRFPASREQSVEMACQAIGRASADLICFPEAFVPGYRAAAKMVAPADAEFLERAWKAIAEAAARARIGVVLGTERIAEQGLLLTALVIRRDGTMDGFQDKCQIDPSEEATYALGSGRRVFEADGVTFGVAICHEGWRYPETVRFAARRGAQIVFHPHFHEAEAGGFRPETFADARNTFHEKAILCRAAENNCFVATVNCASAGSPTTSAVVRPDGTLLGWQSYGVEGLLEADLDLREATGLLASRFRADQVY